VRWWGTALSNVITALATKQPVPSLQPGEAANAVLPSTHMHPEQTANSVLCLSLQAQQKVGEVKQGEAADSNQG
jgi:hypothetical protein